MLLSRMPKRMASGSAIQQNPFLISQGCNSASVLLALAEFAFGVKKQVKVQPMAGILAPDRSQQANKIVASQPLIRHGDQQIHVGIGPGCPPGV
jgi:hypothetical protein